MKKENKPKEYSYKGYHVVSKYRQWYSESFKGSFATIRDFRNYIDAGIGRGNLKDYN